MRAWFRRRRRPCSTNRRRCASCRSSHGPTKSSSCACRAPRRASASRRCSTCRCSTTVVRPAAEPFECLLFDVAGLTLAVPLVCLGSIYPLENQELTPLFGQPDWFLGILPSQAGNLKVLDTARWVMPERYRDDYRDGLKYVISVQGYEWGLAVHQVSRSIRLDPAEVKWRSQRSQRPWLAGTVIEHMCALLDVAALAELIASGAVKRLHGDH